MEKKGYIYDERLHKYVRKYSNDKGGVRQVDERASKMTLIFRDAENEEVEMDKEDKDYYQSKNGGMMELKFNK